MSAVVTVRGLRYTYDDGTEALRGIDFDLNAGEPVALFGANGSGKTTFAMHLNGILRGEGSVIVDGLQLNDANLRAVRQRIGFVFQDSDNQLFMPTVLEDVAFGPLAAGMDSERAESAARAALENVGMAHKAEKAPWHLSAGEKKRVAIAGILAQNPKVLVLDEPTTFLDPPGQRELGALLRSLPQAKILITHDTRFARSLAQEAVFFQDGHAVARGAIDEIVTRFGW